MKVTGETFSLIENEPKRQDTKGIQTFRPKDRYRTELQRALYQKAPKGQFPEEYLKGKREEQGKEEEEKIEYIKIKHQEEENKKRREEIKKIEQIYHSLDPLEQEEIRIETENRLPDFWKVQLNKERIKGKTSKLLEVVLEEKRREIIKEWIEEGKIKGMCNRRTLNI